MVGQERCDRLEVQTSLIRVQAAQVRTGATIESPFLSGVQRPLPVEPQRTFTITSVQLASTVVINSGGAALTVFWAGDPTFPVTMHYQQQPGSCPEGFNCVNPSMTFDAPANPLVFPGAAFCIGSISAPVLFDYEVVLVDDTGLRTEPEPTPVNCLPD